MSKSMRASLIALVIVAGTVVPGQAQITPPDFSMMLATNQELAAGACLAGRCGTPAHSAKEATPSSPSMTLGRVLGQPAPAGARLSLAYVPTPAIRHKIVADLVDRVRRKDPDGAAEIETAFARNDYDRIYDGIAGPYGLSGNDAANAMTAYLVLGWLIANGHQDVAGGRAATMAVRTQVAPMLAGNRAMAPGGWAELGEELKLQFVIAHAGWQASMRQRSGQPYADSIERQFQQIYDIDLRRIALDARGLHAKE